MDYNTTEDKAVAPVKRFMGLYLMGVATFFHLWSYSLPVDGWSGFHAWGWILWNDWIASAFRPIGWSERAVLGLLVYVPLLTLGYALWQRWHGHGPTPLVLWGGLLLPNAMGWVVLLYLARFGYNGGGMPQLAGYVVWNLSFLLYAGGLECHRRATVAAELELNDHLIAEED